MMECWVIDFKHIARDRLAQESLKHPLIAIYADHRYAVVGELAHRLKVSLADILLAHATIDKMDIMVLSFSDYTEAETLFERIPKGWKVEGEYISVQLWHQGQLQAENL